MAATRQKERSETRRLTRPRRVTVDLTPPAVEELELVKEVTRLKTADVFRYAFTLLRIYVAARSEGKDLIIVDPKDPREKTRLELPISIRKQPAQLDRESS